MAGKTSFVVRVDGVDITNILGDMVQSIEVADRAGTGTDTATITIDDAAQRVTFPASGARVQILLGSDTGLGVVFAGTVDQVTWRVDRSGGSMITIEAKGFDASGRIKEPQQRHFDNKTIAEMLTAAGSAVGITDVRVDPVLAEITRPYEAMDDESFLAFGQRLAKEIGGTFKVRNDAAIMVKMGSGRAPSGPSLPPIPVTRGGNLISAQITPNMGRRRYGEIRVRFYDQAAGKHDEIVVKTDLPGSLPTAVGRFEAPNREIAQQKADALREESQRASSAGTLEILGNPIAQPEAQAAIAGVRAGIDGLYFVDGVDHTFSRDRGYLTRLTLANRI